MLVAFALSSSTQKANSPPQAGYSAALLLDLNNLSGFVDVKEYLPGTVANDNRP